MNHISQAERSHGIAKDQECEHTDGKLGFREEV